MKTLVRLLEEEDGICMTDTRGMYGWLAAAAICVWLAYGHRWPEVVAYLEKSLPAGTQYQVR